MEQLSMWQLDYSHRSELFNSANNTGSARTGEEKKT